MKTIDDKLTATQARHFAKRILAETCSTNVKAVKQFGQWVIKINGGKENCYGRTITCLEVAQDELAIFAND